MTSEPIRFTDGAGYDRFMGVWSRLAGQDFLSWIAPQPGQRWLDVGCGNGAFTQLIAEQSEPLALVGIDPSEAQLAYALVGGKDFGERTGRPAAARQLGVKRGKAAGEAGLAAAGNRCTAPDPAGLQDGGKRSHGRALQSARAANSGRRRSGRETQAPGKTSGEALAGMQEDYRTIVR